MSNSLKENGIITIVVLYLPDNETIGFIDSIVKKGLCVIAVVNAIHPSAEAQLESIGVFKIVRNSQNLGLSRAINQGCELAFDAGAGHVFLLDQDSRPEVTLPDELLSDWRVSSDRGISIGVIGPVLIDVKSARYGDKIDHTISDLPCVSSVETLATSGSLISKEAFEAVGEMYEWLFIDDIDHEWCFRAHHCNMAVLRANRRTMLHNMGDDGITIFGRYRPLHRSPVRHHYIVRNTMFIIRQPYVRWQWRLREAAKTLYRVLAYLALSSDRKMTVKKLILGFREGLQHKREPKIE